MNPAGSLPFPVDASTASGAEADAEPSGFGELVTITRVFNSLEAEGIPATLGDAQTIQTDTLLTIALGGIRVMVPAPFADAARATVKAFECGALAIDELPSDAQAATPEVDAEVMSRPGWSPTTWIILAVVLVAVVVF
jgi:hypothetical protein